MRIQKLLVLVYVAAIGGAVFQQAKADDTEIQRRAREMLRQTMATNLPPEAPAAPATPVAPVVPVVTNPPAAPAPAPAPDAVPSPAMPVVEKAAPVVVPVTPDAAPVANLSVEEQLRENVRKQIAAQNTKKGKSAPGSASTVPAGSETPYPVYKAPTTPETPTADAPVAPVVTPEPPATTEMGIVNTSSTNAASSNLDQELREKMRQRMAELDAQNKTSRKAAATPSQYANAPYANPAPAPVALVPGSKEARLDELLQQYKADQITPAEYHRKRSEIIAGP